MRLKRCEKWRNCSNFFKELVKIKLIQNMVGTQISKTTMMDKTRSDVQLFTTGTKNGNSQGGGN